MEQRVRSKESLDELFAQLWEQDVCTGNKEADKVLWGDGDELTHVDMVMVIRRKHSVGIAGGSGNGII